MLESWFSLKDWKFRDKQEVTQIAAPTAALVSVRDIRVYRKQFTQLFPDQKVW